MLKTHSTVIARFFIWYKLSKIQFFEEIFLLTNTSIKVVLGIFFLIFGNVNIWFDTQSIT